MVHKPIVGKIIDLHEDGRVLEPTLFKPMYLLNLRAQWLNSHELTTAIELGLIDEPHQFQPRFQAVNIDDEDILPVTL